MNGILLTSSQAGPKSSYEEIARDSFRVVSCYFFIEIRAFDLHGKEKAIVREKRIQIAELSGVDIETANKEDLEDLSGFPFDTAIPQEQRAAKRRTEVQIHLVFVWERWV